MELSVNLSSPRDVADAVAMRVRQRRLDANLTQEGLAARAKVSLGTLKLFERTGKASIQFLIAVAFALRAEDEFGALFPAKPKKSLDDVRSKPVRSRGRQK